MPFIPYSEYLDRFAPEEQALENEKKAILASDPKALAPFSEPYDNRYGFLSTIGRMLIALLINVGLTLFLAAVMDETYPNYDTMPEEQRKAITDMLLYSLALLPALTMVFCILHDIVCGAKIRRYKRRLKSNAYREAAAIQQAFEEKKADCERRIEEFDRRTNPIATMGVIYLDGGAPAKGNYMADLCVDGEESELLISYARTPYEVLLPAGSHDISIKRGGRVLWHQRFSFYSGKVYTVDIAGAADSSELSGNLDRYSQGGASSIRYQEITKDQYLKARAGLSRRPTAFVLE